MMGVRGDDGTPDANCRCCRRSTLCRRAGREQRFTGFQRGIRRGSSGGLRFQSASATPRLGLRVERKKQALERCCADVILQPPDGKRAGHDRQAPFPRAPDGPPDCGGDRAQPVHRQPRVEAQPVEPVQRERVVPPVPSRALEDRSVDRRAVLLRAGRATPSRQAAHPPSRRVCSARCHPWPGPAAHGTAAASPRSTCWSMSRRACRPIRPRCDCVVAWRADCRWSGAGVGGICLPCEPSVARRSEKLPVPSRKIDSGI